MVASAKNPDSGLLFPSPHFPTSVNRQVIQSELEGGLNLNDVLPGSTFLIRTRSRWYTLVYIRGERAFISGHPEFCPQPVGVSVTGSTWGGSMLKTRFVGRGMRLEFEHPDRGTILTSQILEIIQN